MNMRNLVIHYFVSIFNTFFSVELYVIMMKHLIMNKSKIYKFIEPMKPRTIQLYKAKIQIQISYNIIIFHITGIKMKNKVTQHNPLTVKCYAC